MPVVPDTKQQVENQPRPTSSRSALNTVTTVALFGITLAYAVNFLLAYVFGGVFVAALLIIGGIMLVGACISLLRVRWIGAVGALLALGAISTQMSVGINQYFITHPADAPSFITLLVILSFGLMAAVAGIASTIWNYRSPGQPAPRSLRLLLTSFATFVAGMIVVSLIVAANPPTSVASTTTNGQPTVHMSGAAFVQNVVLVPKGSKLLLVDDGNYNHVLRNGMWMANGSQDTSTEPGAPAVNNVTINGGSLTLGPFNTAGIYHIYCTIHRNMNLTIVVQ
jgi:hypothetical protein